MKISAFSSLVKKTKMLIIYDAPSGVQWLSDGYACYPTYDLPKLDEKGALAILDIPPTKWAEYHVDRKELPAALNFEDEDETETMIKDGDLGAVTYQHAVMMLARTSAGLRLYNGKYLLPLKDVDFEMYERETEDGFLYFAAKSGLLLRAIIMPMRTDYAALSNELQEMANAAARTATLDAEEKAAEEQMTIEEEEG